MLSKPICERLNSQACFVPPPIYDHETNIWLNLVYRHIRNLAKKRNDNPFSGENIDRLHDKLNEKTTRQ